MDRKKRAEGPKLHVPCQRHSQGQEDLWSYGIWTRKRRAPKSDLWAWNMPLSGLKALAKSWKWSPCRPYFGTASIPSGSEGRFLAYWFNSTPAFLGLKVIGLTADWREGVYLLLLIDFLKNCLFVFPFFLSWHSIKSSFRTVPSHGINAIGHTPPSLSGFFEESKQGFWAVFIKLKPVVNPFVVPFCLILLTSKLPLLSLPGDHEHSLQWSPLLIHTWAYTL